MLLIKLIGKQNILVLCGIAAPVIFTLNIIIWGSLTPGYAHLNQYVSELGAMEAPFADFMNWLGIVPFGALICFFSLGYRFANEDKVSRWLTVPCLFLAGICFIIAGFYSCDAGCNFTDMSLPAIIHNVSAFSAFILAIFAVAFTLLSNLVTRVHWRLMTLNMLFLLAMVSTFAGLIYVGPVYEFVGAVQRGFLLPLCLWLFFSGMQLLD